MKRKILCLGIMVFFLMNNVAAIGVYNDINPVHWVSDYANSLAQSLKDIKNKPEQKDDIFKEYIDIIYRDVLTANRLDERITFSNWQKLVAVVLGEHIGGSDLDKDKITREDALASVMSILEKRFNLKRSYLNNLQVRDKFKDRLPTDEKKIALIGLAYNQGIISGYDDLKFRPKDYLKNSEAIAIIERISRKYNLQEKIDESRISLINKDGFVCVDSAQTVEEAFWTSDKGILLVYTEKDSSKKRAAKISIDEKKVFRAFEYDDSNLTANLFNENAFSEERGYISANKLTWNKKRRYVNIKGEFNTINIPYGSFSVSDDQRRAIIQDQEEQVVRVYDFLMERSSVLDEYFRWADEKYTRGVLWSPDSRYFLTTLFKPGDDIGITDKTRFAIFDSNSGELLKIVQDKGYYSFYPAWSVDGSKIAFYRVKSNDEELEGFLNNSIDSRFDLLSKEIGIYDVNTGVLKYYPFNEEIIFSGNSDGLVWSPQGDALYIQAIADKETFLTNINKNYNLDISQNPKDIWKLDIKTGVYTNVIRAEMSFTQEDRDLTGDSEVFYPVDRHTEEEHQEDVYIVKSSLESISPSGERILYIRQPYNMTQYENIQEDFVIRNIKSGEDKYISDMLVTDHWWLNDDSLLVVETESIRSKYRSKLNYVIKKITPDFKEIEMARFEQYPTAITLSPDKSFLMLHQYRANKDLKILPL